MFRLLQQEKHVPRFACGLAAGHSGLYAHVFTFVHVFLLRPFLRPHIQVVVFLPVLLTRTLLGRCRLAHILLDLGAVTSLAAANIAANAPRLGCAVQKQNHMRHKKGINTNGHSLTRKPS